MKKLPRSCLLWPECDCVIQHQEWKRITDGWEDRQPPLDEIRYAEAKIFAFLLCMALHAGDLKVRSDARRELAKRNWSRPRQNSKLVVVDL
jgi:hypothetical protein